MHELALILSLRDSNLHIPQPKYPFERGEEKLIDGVEYSVEKNRGQSVDGEIVQDLDDMMQVSWGKY